MSNGIHCNEGPERLTPEELLRYSREIPNLNQFCVQQLDSLGRRGRGDLIRALVAMFSNDHHDQSLHIPINRVVYDLRKVLESVFLEHQLARPYGSSLSGRKARYDDLATVDSRLTAIGCLDWYECVVGTDSSKLKFKGPRFI